MTYSKGRRLVIIVVLSLCAGMVYLTPFLRFTFYDQMMTALQLDDAQLGVIGATYGAFNVIGYIPSGFLSEKFNSKLMIIVSLIGMLACTVWYCTYPPYGALIVIHALFGIFSVGTFWCSYLKSIRSLGSDEEQGRMFGLSEGVRGLGNCAIAFACLGIIGAFAQATVGFRALLWFNAGMFALLIVLMIFLVPNLDGKKSKKAAEAAQDTAEAPLGALAILKKMFLMLKNPSIWICILLIACGYCLWNTVNGYFGTFTTRMLNVDENISSTLSIVRSYLIVFIAGVSGGIVMDRFKTKGKGMMVVFACTGAFTALICFVTGASMFCVVITLVVAYFVNILKSTYWSILGDAGIAREDTGVATSIISLIGLTPDIFAPAVVSRFIDWGEKTGNLETGFNMMFIWMVAWAALGIVAGLILMRHKKKADKVKELESGSGDALEESVA